MKHQRSSGILLPVSSLPGPYGIGDFGASARRFAEDLSEAGFSYWQILPLNPLGFGHSPYQPLSSFALDPIYADLGALFEEGLIPKKEPIPNSGRVDFEAARSLKEAALKEAFRREKKRNPDCMEAFVKSHPWAKRYAAFSLFRKKNGGATWDHWTPYQRSFLAKRRRIPKRDRFAYEFELYCQYKLYGQWEALHRHCASLGISIIGDLPFYVGYDSCDVWAEQNGFLLDRKSKLPAFVAGVPPDYFSATGQRWGNPIYDWRRLSRTDFRLLRERIEQNASLYDVLRLDHFRAFDTYWRIPSSCPTAIDGKWIEPPGRRFFASLFEKDPSLKEKLIAEDLGNLRKEVYELRDELGLPGMDVVQFTFEESELRHQGAWDKENSIVYLGTHDNDTCLGFFYSMDRIEQAKWVLALERKGIAEGSMPERLLRYALSKKAMLVVLTVQDVLGLDSDARINVPGEVSPLNWSWRLVDFKALEEKLPSLRKALQEEKRCAR